MRPLLLLLACLALPLAALEPLVTRSQASVTVAIGLEEVRDGGAVLVARFTPDPAENPPLHLYGKDHAGSTGVPTRLRLAPGSPAQAAGPLGDDRAVHVLAGQSVYPAGPVTLRLPIRLPAGAVGSTVPLEVRVDYMACTEEFCKRPVEDLALVLPVPTVPAPAGAAPPAAPALDEAALARALSTAVAREVTTALQRELAAREDAIRWRRPATLADVETILAEAKAAQRAVLLDFTGPSCTVCQQMARTVLRDRRVIAGWNAAVPVEIDTDTHGGLADWQQARFQTQNRPLYVRLAPDGTETRWSEVFRPDDAATMERFLAFLGGGAGADVGGADGWLGFLVLAVLGGLFTLVMPCTYPMIPFTITFFGKQAAAGKRIAPLAAFYALGIVGCFVGVAVVVTGLLGVNLSRFSGHPVTNLVLAVLFAVLGISLLGAFLLRLPARFENAVGGGRGGYLGALVMGLTFAVTAFACTAPFAGTVLGAAVASGTGAAWTRAVVGMAIYGAVIAIPFLFLALSPGLLTRLPKAGGWMNEFKVVGGIVEIAAALKFLAIADYHWQWGVITRDTTMAAWAVCAAFIACYLLGRIRMSSDTPVETVGATRVLLALTFAAVALWLASGVFGADLGLIESFFPAHP